VTWLPGVAAGSIGAPSGVAGDATDWHRLSALSPEAFGALAGLVAAAWAEGDPVLVELARLRTATLLGYHAELGRRSARAQAAGLTEAKLVALPAWPTSPLFTARERACLALTEQFVMDANGVTDALVGDVTRHLGPEGCYTFVQTVSVLETFQRACLTLGIETAPEVDELAALAASAEVPR
jgi:alkylhydroperoxidase family enzyme